MNFLKDKFLRTLTIFVLFVLSMSAYGYIEKDRQKAFECHRNQKKECDLAGTDLSYLVLGSLYLDEPNLSYSDLSGTDLRDVVFPNATWLGAIYDQFTTFPKDFDPYEHGMVFFQRRSPLDRNQYYTPTGRTINRFSRRF